MPQNEVADFLAQLAEREFAAAQAEVDRLTYPAHAIFLIEACRVFDYRHVLQFISRNPENRLPDFEFDIIVRGWNPLLGMLLPHIREMGGIPAMESTAEFRSFVLSILHTLGKAALLRENARMMVHGMAEGTIEHQTISLRMSARCNLDHFLDRLEGDQLKRLEQTWPGGGRFEQLINDSRIVDLDARMDALLFPWKPNDRVTMVGYGAEPDIDAHYLALVTECTASGRDDAGIHPEAQFGGVSGNDLCLIVFMITSFYLKHIRFVDRGKAKYPDVNYPMSLTIWKSRRELVSSISTYTGLGLDTVSRTIDLLTVKAKHHAYFLEEPTMFIPMLIELSDDYLLAPVSSVFRNPFHGIRALYEWSSGPSSASMRAPRERWMTSELYNLFLGPRYECMKNPTRLSRKGSTVTDVDAAIFDRSTGELALFQLKWQDFSSNDVSKQRSRAKNFVEKVDSWAAQTEAWVSEFGEDALLQALRFSAAGQGQIEVRLFAIGRSAARFRSYGYVAQNPRVAAAAWRQFIRLRYEIGPSPNVFADLHSAIQSEQARPVARTAVRQEMKVGDYTIVFEDLWNQFDN